MIARIAIAAFVLAGALVPVLPAFAQELKAEINGIQQDVSQKKSDLVELQKKSDKLRALIAEKKEESASLADQVALLDNSLASSQLEIEIAKEEIRRLVDEIDAFDAKIAEQERSIARDKELAGALSRTLYRAQFRRSTFEILVSRPSLSEFFDEVRRLAGLQQSLGGSLVRLKAQEARLRGQRAERDTAKLAVEDEKRGLETKRNELEDERALKDALLLDTKASELEYRYALAELKREQSQADNEIAYLERVLREKLDLADRLKGASALLSWPLVPARGLSTQFHDPEYPFRHVFEHPGVDIRAGQGTPVRAAAAGIVARAKNAGMGYSYVMVIHNDNVSTVYGHLSRIASREDAFVERGEIIGYSGGMPGTPGAGRLTTGPHLHFETRLRGIPVNPLHYLISAE